MKLLLISDKNVVHDHRMINTDGSGNHSLQIVGGIERNQTLVEKKRDCAPFARGLMKNKSVVARPRR